MLSMDKKTWLTEDIEWYIQTLKKDKRRLTPEKRLELAAEFIDLAMELVGGGGLQRICKESRKRSGEKQN